MTSQLSNKAFALVTRKLARKSCHSRELRAALVRYGFAEEEITLALERAASYIDDEAWLRDQIAKYASRGKSNLEIMAKLSSKGIPKSEYERLLPRGPGPLSTLIQKKYRILLEEGVPREERLKALASIARRGFSHSQIEAALSEGVPHLS